jgi:spoIIIJ-associated protein
MKELEVSGRTVDEAVRKALEQLGVGEDEIEVVVLKKGRSGLLGVGAEEAKVRVRLLRPQSEKVDIANLAKDVLTNLLKYMGIKAEVSIVPPTSGDLPISLDIDGEDLGVLIGRRGQTLSSLQYLVRLIVSEKLKIWVAINVDIAGYKKRRYESLRNLALRLAEQAKRSRRAVTLEPMPADERRIIHLTLADHPDVTTQSMGEGEERKVVIFPRKR